MPSPGWLRTARNSAKWDNLPMRDEPPTDTAAAPTTGAAPEIDTAREYEVTAEYQSWRVVWGSAAALLAVGVGIGAAILLGWFTLAHRHPDQPGAAATPPPAGLTTRSAPTAAPPSTLQSPDLDSVFLGNLHDRGISFTNPDAAVYNGKMVCTNLGGGMTVQQVVEALQSSSPALGDRTTAYVAVSIRTYCPKYDAVLPPGS